MNVCEVTYNSKKSRKKTIVEKALPLDLCTNFLSSVPETTEKDEKISPTEFFSISSKMQPEVKKRKIPKFDQESIAVKEEYFRKVWYVLYGTTYGTWSAALQEYYIDYDLLWKNIVEPELFARGALLSWRTFPCRKIMTVLPKGYSSWTELLKNGGVTDKATNQGSFTEHEKKYFWNDQCSCPCWKPLFEKNLCIETSEETCVCKIKPCQCNETVVDNSWETQVEKLKKLAKQCPWNTNIPLQIIKLQENIDKNVAPLPNVTYKEYVLGKQESIEIQKEIQKEEMFKDTCTQKCFDFFYNLENDYIRSQKHAPKTGEELLEWFWKGKTEFLQVYRSYCPEERFKLSYIL